MANDKSRKSVAYLRTIYPFRSELKRMTTIVNWDAKSRDTRILCKGAPEIIEGLL